MPRERKTYSVYIMGSLSGTLYIGMTSNLHKRVFQHKFHRIEGFTDQYQVERLLYYESFDEVVRDQSRKAVEGLEALQENCPDRVAQSPLGGPGAWLVPVDVGVRCERRSIWE